MEIFITILAVLGGLLLVIILFGHLSLKSEEKSKKVLEDRSKKFEELRAIIIAKYKEVVNEDFETRRKAIFEIAETVGLSAGVVAGVLKRKGLNTVMTDVEEQQGRIEREEKRLADYIADEYNKILDKPEIIRKRRIIQIAEEMEKSTEYVVTKLRKKKCKDIPKV